MIQGLIVSALKQLSDDLLESPGATASSSPKPKIVAGPIEPPTSLDQPWIVLSPGSFTFNQKIKDLRFDQARPCPIEHRISIDPKNSVGPYTLTHPALKGPSQATLVWDEGSPEEIRQPLSEGMGFTIDETRRLLTLDQPVDSPSDSEPILIFETSTPGVFGVREFQQTLCLQTFANSAAEAERWASLTAGVILTQAERLLANSTMTYGASALSAAHRFEQIELIEGKPGVSDSPIQASLQLIFRVHGQLRVTRALTESVGIIERVISPGVKSQLPIAIKANLA